MMAKLRHITITVPDPESAAQFYINAFGMERVGGTDWANAKGVYLSDGTVNLALLKYKNDTAAGERGADFVGIHHLGFWVDDVSQTREKIAAHGGQYWMGDVKHDGGFYEVKYFDPQGVVVDITEHGWKGATKDVIPQIDTHSKDESHD
jgi:catechol 2,3-dioxygenase-like lactoylglutathione lyase family enzyme